METEENPFKGKFNPESDFSSKCFHLTSLSHLGMELAGTYLQSLNKIVKICDRHAGRQGVTIEKKLYMKNGAISVEVFVHE